MSCIAYFSSSNYHKGFCLHLLLSSCFIFMLDDFIHIEGFNQLYSDDSKLSIFHLSPELSCCCLVTKSCLTLCDPMDCCLPGSSVHGLSQTRILEWVAISFSEGSSWLRDQTQVSCIAGRRFTLWATNTYYLTSPPGDTNSTCWKRNSSSVSSPAYPSLLL